MIPQEEFERYRDAGLIDAEAGWMVPRDRGGDGVAAEIWDQVGPMLLASDVSDAESVWAKLNAKTWEIRVRSTSRGFVAIGTLEYFPLARLFLDELEAQIEPFRSGAELGKQRRLSPKVARARELRALDLSETAIARKMLDEGHIRSKRRDPAKRLANARKSVHRWLNVPE